jgi:predicted porin
MKKTLIALAAVAATGAVFAQSSVTAYGRVDLSLARNVGSDTTVMQNGSGSRLGFRGNEDLGGGLKALFQIEHRFNADTGEQTSATKYWAGRSIVGLSGGFGTIQFGRDYSPAFLYSQLAADPWGWDTVAANSRATGGAIAPVRNDNAMTYIWSGAGLTVAAQAALKENAEGATKNPVALAVRYANGPIMAAVAHDRTATGGKWTTVNGSYDLGAVKLGALFGTGTTAADHDHDSYLLTAVAPLGAGELRFSVGQLKDKTADVVASRQIGLGYHYSLSKRTTVYVDVVNDNKRTETNKTGVDFGLKHNF